MFKSKLVSKRQLQRRIKNTAQALKNQILAAKPCEIDRFDNFVSSSLPANIGAIKVLQNDVFPILVEKGKIQNSQNVNSQTDLREDLRNWVTTHNITRNAVTALLKICHPHLPFLPYDCRGLMKTPRKTVITKLKNGKLTYFGLEEKLKLRLRSGFKNHVDKILLQINIDGLPLFKSSSLELYPILVRCIDLVDSSPFTVALYCGTGKPDPLDIFLFDFIQETAKLKQDGILYAEKCYSVDIQLFVCDAPARAYLRQTIGHTGKEACEKCTILGTYHNHRINFAQQNFTAFDSKLDTDFTSSNPPTYIKGHSPLLNLGIKLVTQFPLDPMHLIFLGVVRRVLLNYFFERSSPFRLSQKIITDIDTKISVVHSHITSDFSRKSRSLKEIHRWKATEYRLFIMYTYPVLFFNAINQVQFDLILSLHCAVFILSDADLILKYSDFAETCLNDFVIKSATVFDKDFVVFNVHNLNHLVDDVKLYGTINDFSCFPFENYLNTLKRKVHSYNKPLEQIHRRIHECDNNNSNKSTKKVKSDCEAKFIYDRLLGDDEEVQSFSCKKLVFPDGFISVFKPNNRVMLKTYKVCIIQSVRYIEGTYFLEGLYFSYYDDLYVKPIRSSKLGIFYIKKICTSNAISFKLSDILFKCLLLPHKEGYAAFPLMHLKLKF